MLHKINWTDTTQKALKKCAGDDMDIIKSQVKTGIAQLWGYDDGLNLALFVTRIDNEPGGRELVIVLGESVYTDHRGLGHCSGFSKAVELFKKMARDQNIATIRTHVTRHGLIRMYNEIGFDIDSYVLKYEVKNGQ